MADELELDLSEGQDIDRTEVRIKNLSSKVKETASERDEATKKAEEAELARQAAEKDRDFYKDFSGMASKYPGAPEFQDAILEKVRNGYSVEDATVSVLNSEGKLLPQAEQAVQHESVAGGSAVTAPFSIGTKTLAEMSLDEKRDVLVELEKRGDISLN
jgi:hypothetical protein